MLFCSAPPGNSACWADGQSRPNKGAEHDAGNELAHHRRLAEALRSLTHQPADQKEKTKSAIKIASDGPAARSVAPRRLSQWPRLRRD